MNKIERELRKFSLMSMYRFLDDDPEKNLPLLIDWTDRYLSPNVLREQRRVFRDIIERKDSNWYRLIVSLWDDIDDGCRKTLFENIVINANAEAAKTAEESRAKYHCAIPWVIDLDISEEPGSLDFDELDNVIEQAKALGTFVFILRGKEPLRSKEEIIALCNKHSECEFGTFTSGELLDEEFADQILRVKNFVTVLRISQDDDVELLEHAASVLRSRKLPYIAVVMYDEESIETYSEEVFFDFLIEQGVKMALFVSTVPEEKDDVYRSILKFRETKPILAMNFCKDRTMLGGCMAGGRYYCSIARNGDVEPCFLLHQSDSNIRERSLVEALQAPLFRAFADSGDECEVISRKRKK